MTKLVVVTVALGVVSGFTFIPDVIIASSDTILTVGLCILLFFVGIDIGFEGTVVENFKKVGWRILMFPLATIVGTLLAGVVSALLLPISIKDGLAVASGFAWYSLAPIMLAKYSAMLSAISFLHNVFRELLGIIMIPFVAKYIGYVETTSLPGAAAMDVCLPVVEKATNANIAVYSFVSGLVLTLAVPVLVEFFASL